MRNNFKSLLLFTVLISLGSNLMLAQTNFKLYSHSENSIEISGTSMLNNWIIRTTGFTGNAQLKLKPGNDILSLNALKLTVPVIALKSDNEVLDKEIYKALKVKRFKNITFQLTSSEIIGEEDYTYLIATIGNLTIAGVTKKITIDIYCMANKDGSITCRSKYILKMMDYGVKSPANFGEDGIVKLDICMRFER